MKTVSMDDLVMKDLLQTNQQLKNENKRLQDHLDACGLQSKISSILQSKYSDKLVNDDKSTEIILVRHGQTEWNVIRRMQGQWNSELTKVGLSGAKKVGKKLYLLHKNGKKIDFVYSSPLKRARQTAEIIMSQFEEKGEGLKITFDDRIMERNFGELQGMTKDEIKKNKPKIHEHMYTKMNYKPPGDGAESFLDVIDRASEFIAEIAAKHQGKRVLVVCHGGVLKAICNDILLHSSTLDRRFHPKNCAINIIERIHDKQTWFVSVLGDDEYGYYQTLNENKATRGNKHLYGLSYLALGLAVGGFIGYKSYNMRKKRR